MAPKVISVFVNYHHLSAAGIQFLVGLTTLLMVLRFVLDFLRHRSISQLMRKFLLMLDTATYALLQYSLGVMQRPSLKNSYYQVWAVLLVTLRYSVKHGRPAGVAFRQTPLVDLMSSFWAANILRSRAPALLKIPVWLLWSINSARIIHGFVSSEHATANHKDNVRLVTEYMRPKTPASGSVDPATMAGYKYLVLGEAKQRKKVRPPHYRLELELTNEEKLITVDKIWNWSRDESLPNLLKQDDGKLKDLCLSFALYKLLRRRFFNLPIHESNREETRQLVFQGILNRAVSPSGQGVATPARVEAVNSSGSGPRGADEGERQSTDHQPVPNYKRALRITKVELSFLNDFFFSRHALIFATGFPFLRLLLSTLLVGAISYMAVAIHRFSKIAKEDELGRVHHGVFFTWILLTLLGVKEIIEIASYVFSDWTKVLLVCKYVRQPWWLRGPVMAMLVRILCRYSLVRTWDGKIGQYILLFSVGPPYMLFEFADFTEEMQKAIFICLSSLRDQSDFQPSKTPLYVQRALRLMPTEEGKNAIKTAINDVLQDLKEDVHMILLWHIATCYCECHLADKRDIDVRRPRIEWILWLPTYKRARIWTGPFIQPSKLESSEDAPSFTRHYITAVSLSQYCAHLLRLTPALIPGNDIIITAVLDEVIRETRQALKGCFSLSQTFKKLKETLPSQNVEGSSGEEANQQDDQGSIGVGENHQDNQGSIREEANQQDHQESIIVEENRQDNQGSSTGEEANQQDNQGPVVKEENDADNQRNMLKMGSELGQKLIETTNDNDEVVWKFLEELWAGFVLHLAESTRASKHKIYLSTGGDLMTHIWALLSHAGFMGKVAHGDMDTGAMLYQEPDRQAININNN